MAIERVEILLSTSVPQDPLQKKLVLDEIEKKDAETRKELDTFLKTGWREIGSGMVTIQDKGTVLEQRLVIILFKDDRVGNTRVLDGVPNLYLQPVWDEDN